MKKFDLCNQFSEKSWIFKQSTLLSHKTHLITEHGYRGGQQVLHFRTWVFISNWERTMFHHISLLFALNLRSHGFARDLCRAKSKPLSNSISVLLWPNFLWCSVLALMLIWHCNWRLACEPCWRLVLPRKEINCNTRDGVEMHDLAI